ncbi:23S rRNA (adenine(2503)-C(2))-methyltransferase RlmN [Oleiharenicola lentus]|uniref:Probable dual-specificity RNA methyltransferase RlmN n=2 Tax=Oleiharenicola lentus TaxID=2508720 RepID=A0A4V1M669_9BACT|nr:23S rRNA (adenine(2503)-C(2))-methyltransferase RlmN [Oleiharenicola lentus]RXK54359.1 23S rRNA (adenine(2503)-C(2))-methyltransferase RlmN [Oleiharenicola lentus]
MMTAVPTSFYDLTREALRQLVVRWGFSSVHAARLWSYVHLERIEAWPLMVDLPARFRERAATELAFTRPDVAVETHSADGFTRKYLLALADGRQIETVLMRYTGRVTACISSQAGCAMGCVFCATGQMGFTRHLTPGEIVTQALHVDRVLRETGEGERLRNIVLMGMGEPLHNYDAVMTAVDILRDPNGLAFGAKKITLSTVGVVPGIIRLADEARPIHLAVSLHGATQAERAALVPVAKKWPLDELMDACCYYIAKQQRRIFYEWTLIEGKNDLPDNAHAVGRLLQGQEAQVNLIPLNPTAGYAGIPTGREAAKRFQQILAGYGLPSTIRQRRGIDIAAGCGQLAASQ